MYGGRSRAWRKAVLRRKPGWRKHHDGRPMKIEFANDRLYFLSLREWCRANEVCVSCHAQATRRFAVCDRCRVKEKTRRMSRRCSPANAGQGPDELLHAEKDS
jgi:hypothetical protein